MFPTCNENCFRWGPVWESWPATITNTTHGENKQQQKILLQILISIKTTCVCHHKLHGVGVPLKATAVKKWAWLRNISKSRNKQEAVVSVNAFMNECLVLIQLGCPFQCSASDGFHFSSLLVYDWCSTAKLQNVSHIAFFHSRNLNDSFHLIAETWVNNCGYSISLKNVKHLQKAQNKNSILTDCWQVREIGCFPLRDGIHAERSKKWWSCNSVSVTMYIYSSCISQLEWIGFFEVAAK